MVRIGQLNTSKSESKWLVVKGDNGETFTVLKISLRVMVMLFLRRLNPLDNGGISRGIMPIVNDLRLTADTSNCKSRRTFLMKLSMMRMFLSTGASISGTFDSSSTMAIFGVSVNIHMAMVILELRVSQMHSVILWSL